MPLKFVGFGGKYNPRSAFFNPAQEYWISQFYATIQRAQGKPVEVTA